MIFTKEIPKDAILVCYGQRRVTKALDEVSFVEGSYFNFNQEWKLKKRDIFPIDFKIVGNDNFRSYSNRWTYSLWKKLK